MACIINASTSNGLVNSADGSGQLKVQSNGVTTNALAWVNFNGTGTVAIRSSYNVSSITDNGTGTYTINFATALSDANYSAVSMSSDASAGTVCFIDDNAAAPTTTALRIRTAGNSSTSNFDVSYCCVSIFGN